jgi:hypothetical protein
MEQAEKEVQSKSERLEAKVKAIETKKERYKDAAQ